MAKNLNEALDNVDKTYEQLIEIAEGITDPITKEIDDLIKHAVDNVERLTNDDIRDLLLKLSLKAYSFSAIKEKAALKNTSAETLKDEAYARKFNESEGTVAFKQNTALLETSYETLSEAIYDEASSILKVKLDEIHRNVDTLKVVLMSRMQEAKLSSINCEIGE